MAKKRKKRKGGNKPRRDLYQEVTDAVVAQLEKGTAPWVRPWSRTGGAPRSALTGREYNGSNVLFMGMVQAAEGYEAPLWGTLRSWQLLLQMPTISDNLDPKRRILTPLMDLQGNTKRQPATPCIYVRTFEREELVTNADGQLEEQTRRFASPGAHWMFNLDQVLVTDAERERILARRGVLPPGELNEIERDDRCDQVVRDSGADITHQGEQACYRIDADRIYMPKPETFKDAGAYYAVLFHEIGHWTGHESRLGRDIRNGFGTAKYAEEELIAEMCSAFLCARLEVDGMLQHASYIKHWLTKLKNDKSFFFRAARAASAAAELVLPADKGEEHPAEKAA